MCAIDPEHCVLFADGTVWPLLALAKVPLWRVAWAVADRTGAKPMHTPVLGLQHLATRLVDLKTLWAHEALGGKSLTTKCLVQCR